MSAAVTSKFPTGNVALAAIFAPFVTLQIAAVLALCIFPFALFFAPLLIVALYSTMTLAGVPLFFIFRRMGWANWWTAILLGSCLGCFWLFLAIIVGGPFSIEGLAGPFIGPSILFVGIAAAVGAMTGAIFYMFARLRA